MTIVQQWERNVDVAEKWKETEKNSLEREMVRMIDAVNSSPLPLKRETVRMVDTYNDYDDTF